MSLSNVNVTSQPVDYVHNVNFFTSFLYHVEESVNCVVLKFERLDGHHEGSITLYGVDCGTIDDAKIICEAKTGN